MVYHLSIVLVVIVLCLDSCSSQCPPCVSVDPLPGQPQDDLSGFYSFKEENAECPGGCAYTRSSDPVTVYCFGPGPRTGDYQCSLTNPTQGVSESQISTSPVQSGLGTTNSILPGTTIRESSLKGSTAEPTKTVSASLGGPEGTTQA